MKIESDKKTKKKSPPKKRTAKKNPNGRAVARKAKIISDIADSMKQAESIWGIPLAVQKAAKNAGCPAFERSRVHRKALLEWLEKNPQIVEAGGAKGSEAELKRERLAVQIDHARLKFDREKGVLIPLAEAQESWATCAAIVQEEAKALMERDHYRIFIERIQARLGKLIAVASKEESNKKTKP